MLIRNVQSLNVHYFRYIIAGLGEGMNWTCVGKLKIGLWRVTDIVAVEFPSVNTEFPPIFTSFPARELQVSLIKAEFVTDAKLPVRTNLNYVI